MANVNFMIETSRSDLSSKARLVLNCLAMHCRKDNTSCFPSIKTIGKETGISRSTVIRAIKELVQLNIVEKVARFSENKNGGQTSNMYFLNLNFNQEKKEKVAEESAVEKEKCEEISLEKNTSFKCDETETTTVSEENIILSGEKNDKVSSFIKKKANLISSMKGNKNKLDGIKCWIKGI